MISRIITALLAAKQQLEQGVFQVAPIDYASFRECVGRYRGLEEALRIIEELQEGEEDERSRY